MNKTYREDLESVRTEIFDTEVVKLIDVTDVLNNIENQVNDIINDLVDNHDTLSAIEKLRLLSKFLY